MWGKFQFRSGLRKSVDSKPTTSIRSLKLEPLEDRSVPSAVSFVRVDTTTQGNWLGAYGRDGESLAGSSTQIASYAQVSASLSTTRTWDASTTDPRALETANGAGRIAATWRGFSDTIDVNLTDGKTHQISLYTLDWKRSGQSERVVVSDATTGTVLNSRSESQFGGGQYLVYNVSGHVQFKLATLSGSSISLSGLFFDPATLPTPTVKVIDAGGTYTGADFPATATVADASGTFGPSLEGVTPTLSYFNGTATSGTPLGGAPSIAGIYTVQATFAGSLDYTAASATATFTITSATPAVKVIDAGGTYTGSSFPATATVAEASGTFGPSLEDVTPSLSYFNGTAASGTPLAGAPSVAGIYTVQATFAGSLDYAPATATATFSITSATPTVKVIDAGGVYTGSSFPATATVAGVNLTFGPSLEGVVPSLSYFNGTAASGTPLGGAPSLAGIYTVQATFAGSLDYTAASATATFTITSAAAATPTVKVVDAGGTFTGSSFPATATVAGVNGTYTSSLESVTPTLAYYSGSAASGTPLNGAPSDTGTYTVQATFAGSTNYTSASSTATFTITSATPTVKVVDAGGTFTGSSFPATATVAGVNGTYSSSLESVTPTVAYYAGSVASGTPLSGAPSNTGTYTVQATFAGSANYTTASATTTFAITPTSPPPTSPPPPAGPSGVTVTADWIISPYDRIPNFGGHPTLSAVSSGNWSDPATWGGRLPAAGEVVAIGSGLTVTYDLVSDVKYGTVSIQSGGILQFRTDVNTRLRVTNFMVLPGGTLTVGTPSAPVQTGVKAEVIINNVAIDTTRDPEQYGNGLIAFGTVTMHGAAMSNTFIELAVEPRAGDTTLTLATPVTGWTVGDRLVLPDSRQLNLETFQSPSSYVDALERPIIAAVSPDGRTITLASPLAFDHPGARDLNGHLDFPPHVADLSRNVVVKSESATGTRGYTMFSQRADVDIEGVQFSGLGRSTIDGWDNTQFDGSGAVSHVGANEIGRYPVYFRHLIGPTSAQADGYQFTFVGNSVFCPLAVMTFRWGVAIEDAQYGLIQGNVLYNWAGGGIAGVDAAAAENTVVGNFIAEIRGTGQRTDSRGLGDLGFEGAGIWFRSGSNTISDNVVVDSDYGYVFYSLSSVTRLPAVQGDDPAISSRTVDMSNVPLRFVGNEVYGGRTQIGLELWSIGTNFVGAHADARESVVKDFHVWHIVDHGYFGYETNRVTFDGFVYRAETSALISRNLGAIAIYSGDYFQKDFTIRNSNIQGALVGWYPSTVTGGGVQTIENTYLRNYTNIQMVHLWVSYYYASNIDPRTVVVRNVRFDQIPNTVTSNIWGLGPQENIVMRENPGASVTNYIQSDTLFVYDYNGQVGNNFQAFYAGQAANAIVPKEVLNADGTPQVAGAPVEGLTNAQAWAQYGIAVAGAVAPIDATTLDHIVGLIKPI